MSDAANNTATPGSGIRFQQRAKRSDMGTLGAVLTDSIGGRYALSANHVLARNGLPMRQPGFQVIGTGSPESPRFSTISLGSDVRFFPLFDGGNLDCAIVKAPQDSLKQVFPPQLHNLSTQVVPPCLNKPVCKYGHTTQWTAGVVAGFADVSLNFGPGLGAITISNAILIAEDGSVGQTQSFARPGDSGSLVFQLEDGRWAPMGLLTGGPTSGPPDRPVGGYYAVCPLGQALEALDQQLPFPLRSLRLADPD